MEMTNMIIKINVKVEIINLLIFRVNTRKISSK